MTRASKIEYLSYLLPLQGAFGGLDEWGDNPEDIPDEILLASPAFPSALQVFASVGGLALLAEHLPLLYPDITRQGTTADVGTTDNNNIPDLGQDWVTVESSDELYDVSWRVGEVLCSSCVIGGRFFLWVSGTWGRVF